MLIHVNLCSYRRPLGLLGVVMSLQRMRSMQHEVRFRIGLDVDMQAGHTGPFTVTPDVKNDCVVIAGGSGIPMSIPSSILAAPPPPQKAAVGY